MYLNVLEHSTSMFAVIYFSYMQ